MTRRREAGSASRAGRLRGALARAAALSVALVPLAGLVWSVAARQEEPFPHVRHEGLFPLCTGCHQGVPSGDRPAFYPPPELCARCHDGDVQPAVAWRAPDRPLGNLRFEHAQHARELAEEGDPPAECAVCHIPSGGTRMAVAEEVQVPTCLGCHEHRAGEHFVDAECGTCHVPLAETSFDLPRIAALPEPVDHEPDGFLAERHGEMAEATAGRCATCHTVERCVSCHVDAERPAIRAIPPAPPGMALPPAEATYPVPVNHEKASWIAVHGDVASGGACATCHTTDDCRSCHVAPVPAVVEALPARERVVAPGARLVGRAPATHDSFFFLELHGTLAAAEGRACATCHEESFCVSCHDGPPGGGYHPAHFVARHQAESFGREAECSTCHNTQAFCRKCHVETGVVNQGRVGPGYHAGEPVWLIRHGQAARQNLESCASCHAQTDCTQCHSTFGAFKVNPHSRGFDARKAFERSPRACAACHLTNPLTGGNR